MRTRLVKSTQQKMQTERNGINLLTGYELLRIQWKLQLLGFYWIFTDFNPPFFGEDWKPAITIRQILLGIQAGKFSFFSFTFGRWWWKSRLSAVRSTRVSRKVQSLLILSGSSWQSERSFSSTGAFGWCRWCHCFWTCLETNVFSNALWRFARLNDAAFWLHSSAAL